MISSILVFQLGQARVWFAMSRDRLLPHRLQQRASALPHARVCHLDRRLSWWRLPAGLLRHRHLSDLSNIGTLFAFVLVSIGVIVLRYREPERHRGFRAPFGPVIPVLSIVFCVAADGGPAKS